jgi:hypothetical protein
MDRSAPLRRSETQIRRSGRRVHIGELRQIGRRIDRERPSHRLDHEHRVAITHRQEPASVGAGLHHIQPVRDHHPGHPLPRIAVATVPWACAGPPSRPGSRSSLDLAAGRHQSVVHHRSCPSIGMGPDYATVNEKSVTVRCPSDDSGHSAPRRQGCRLNPIEHWLIAVLSFLHHPPRITPGKSMPVNARRWR